VLSTPSDRITYGSSTTMLPLLLFTALALAQDTQLPASGTLRPGPVDKPAALQAFAAAGQTPNATDSVAFTHANETWTWRINVTDIRVPNTLSDLGTPDADFSKGYHVANTQYQVLWPNSSDAQTLGEYISAPLSVGALAIPLAANLTAPYTATDNGSCVSVLGGGCVDAIKRAIAMGPVAQVVFPECGGSIGANGFTQLGGAGTRTLLFFFLFGHAFLFRSLFPTEVGE
jgi:hypothetical protein